MSKVIEFLEKYFVPVAGKIGAQRHLVAIRDGFVAIMPLIIAGSLAVLINNIPIDAYQNFMARIFGEGWTTFGGYIWNGSFAVMSLLIVFSVSYNLAKYYKSDPMAAGVVAFACLMTIMESAEEAWAIPYTWTGALGLFVSLIVALVATEIFVRLLGNKRLIIKMPEGVPPAVAKSFAALLPALITIVIFGLFKVITVALGMINIHQLIYDVIQAPLTEMANTLSSAVVIVFLTHLLWFFGLHGANIVEPLVQTMYLPALEANMAALSAGVSLPYIVTKPFLDAFVYMGGAGTSIALIVAIYIASKRKQYRSLANLSVAPGVFNINEPIIFGLPIVLNPAFIIPFIIAPIILTIFSFLVTAAGIVPRTVAMIPWTTPPIIGGFLATGGSVMGALLQIVNLLIAILIYLPFVALAGRIEEKRQAEIEIDT